MHFTIHSALSLTAGASLSSWIYLAFARGEFWRLSKVTLPSAGLSLKTPAPSVVAVIPARNEAKLISVAVDSLRQQNYPGPLRIIVVDDHSTDGTIDAISDSHMGGSESPVVLSSQPLPRGWTGKMWALYQGVQRAMESDPEYLLFSDADVIHSENSVASLVDRADSQALGLISALPKLNCSTFAERLLLPAFSFFFFMLYPPDWVRSTKRPTAAASGGNVLARAKTLAQVGGIQQVRDELIDDCALAREIKKVGTIQLGWTENAVSMRPYGGFRAVGRMISRNAYYELRHSPWLLIGSISALALIFIAPPILAFGGGWCSVMALFAWLLMSFVYAPTLRALSLTTLWAPVLPLVTSFYMAATVHSTIQYYRGRGGEWKGRTQDLSRSAFRFGGQ